MSKVIKVTDKTEVYGTGKVKDFPKGEKRTINSVLAEKLVKAEKASYKSVK
jgi:hypothetical protein